MNASSKHMNLIISIETKSKFSANFLRGQFCIYAIQNAFCISVHKTKTKRVNDVRSLTFCTRYTVWLHGACWGELLVNLSLNWWEGIWSKEGSKFSLTLVKSWVQSFRDMDLVRNLFGTTLLLIYLTRCLRPAPTSAMGRVWEFSWFNILPAAGSR